MRILGQSRALITVLEKAPPLVYQDTVTGNEQHTVDEASCQHPDASHVGCYRFTRAGRCHEQSSCIIPPEKAVQELFLLGRKLK
jgi:hypothetical protein